METDLVEMGEEVTTEDEKSGSSLQTGVFREGTGFHRGGTGK